MVAIPPVVQRLQREGARLSPGLWLRFAIRRMTRPDTVRLHGVFLALPPELPDDVRLGIYAERYERGEARCVLQRLVPGDRVVEMGTGLGYLTVLCCQRLGSQAVHSFEANAGLLPTIRHNFELNGVSPRCTHALLGRGTGSRAFHQNTAFVSSSTRPRSGTASTVEVPQLDVDQAIQEAAANCIVMDVEGAEEELIRQIDWQPIDKLIVEFHPSVIGEAAVRDLASHLAAQGLRLDRAISSHRKRYYRRAAP